MTPDRFRRVREIVDDLLDGTDVDREDRLSRFCHDDPVLQREVRSYLHAADRCPDRFLSLPEAEELEVVATELEAREWVGRRVGAYRITTLLAVGGMGAVFRAERADGAYRQEVAIKVISCGMESARTRRRFHGERQALAVLDHPNIARLLDGGATPEGRPYLVMELIEGEPIDRYCDRRRLGLAARIRLMRTVCEAVHCAHQKLIVHCDLKPANILVTPEGVPKLVDFGIARLVDRTSAGSGVMTTATSCAMTPQYCSPEQIRGESTTTGTDVYSLGVVMYELLSGHRPYEADGSVRYEIERDICEVDPLRPSAAADRPKAASSGTIDEIAARRGETPRSLRARLRGDLDVLILRTMARDPQRRYGSVRELSEDLARYLDGLPVSARRDTLGYRMGKFVRRHRGAVAAALVVLVTLVTGLAGTSLGLLRAHEERTAALEAKASAEAVTAFFHDLLADANPYRYGDNVTILEMLAGASGRIESELAGRPDVEAGVRYAIGRTYLNMWQAGEAVPHLERAVVLYEARRPGSAELADALSAFGRALTFASEPRAIDIQKRALSIRTSRFGPRSAATAESTGNLAYALWHAQEPPDWEHAEALYRRAIGMYETIGQGSCRDAARFTFSLAVMLANSDRVEASEQIFARSLAIYDALPTGDDRYMVECMIKYAGVLQQLGRFDEAEALLDRATAMTPPELRRVGLFSITWRRGGVRHARGEPDDALRLWGAALADEMERHLGHDCIRDPAARTLPARLRSGEVGLEDLAAAFDVLRREECLPSLALLRPIDEVAALCREQGRWATAISLLEGLSELRAQTFPAGHACHEEAAMLLERCRTQLGDET